MILLRHVQIVRLFRPVSELEMHFPIAVAKVSITSLFCLSRTYLEERGTRNLARENRENIVGFFVIMIREAHSPTTTLLTVSQ
jgi:hypothetical protein